MKNKLGIAALVLSILPWVLGYFTKSFWDIFSWTPGLKYKMQIDGVLFNYATIICFLIAGVLAILAIRKKEKYFYSVITLSQLIIFSLWMLFEIFWMTMAGFYR